MPKTFVIVALALIEVALFAGAVFFGWRPFSRVIKQLWWHALRFLVVFFASLVALTITIPIIDTAFYMNGVTLSDDFMIVVAPTVVIVLSLAAAVIAVWHASRRI